VKLKKKQNKISGKDNLLISVSNIGKKREESKKRGIGSGEWGKRKFSLLPTPHFLPPNWIFRRKYDIIL